MEQKRQLGAVHAVMRIRESFSDDASIYREEGMMSPIGSGTDA